LVNFDATQTKICGLPIVSNDYSQLFRAKNVIQTQLWFLKIKKLGSKSNYNYEIWTSLLEPELELLASNPQMWVTNQHWLLPSIKICMRLHDEEVPKFS
jgi:hypothetical protein